MGISLFFAIAITILFVAHCIIYSTLVKFFTLSRGAKIGLATVLFLLGVSFIAASFIAHWNETPLTKGYYFIASVWIGVMTNLVLSFIVLRLAYWGLHLFHITPSGKMLPVIFIILPFIISLWGMYRAYVPVVREHTLQIANLPQTWKGKRIVQISDVHLGLSNGLRFLERVVTMANEQKPDLILITGDLFDGGDGNLEVFVPLLNKLQAPLGIYFITGNHETYLGLDEVGTVLKQTPIITLDDKAVELEGVRLIGISYPERGKTKDIGSVIRGLTDDQLPQLLLYHTPTELALFEQAGIDMMFSGHTHRGQLFPFGFITAMIYDGYDRGLNQIGKMQLYVSSGTGTWGPPIKTSGRTEITVFILE